MAKKITKRYAYEVAKEIVWAIRNDKDVRNMDMKLIIEDWQSYWADSNRLSIGMIATIIYDNSKLDGFDYDFETIDLTY